MHILSTLDAIDVSCLVYQNICPDEMIFKVSERSHIVLFTQKFK